MIKGGRGGANTKTGLLFEGRTDLATFLSRQPGYSVEGNSVFFFNEEVALVFKKRELYNFLEDEGVDWQGLVSHRLEPDNCLFVLISNTLFIIECKFQQVSGSVDEKLQTCDYKKRYYKRLLSRANIEVEYMYLLSNWFRQDKYSDVLNYIHDVGCHYYFDYIPLTKLGLPVPEAHR